MEGWFQHYITSPAIRRLTISISFYGSSLPRMQNWSRLDSVLPHTSVFYSSSCSFSTCRDIFKEYREDESIKNLYFAVDVYQKALRPLSLDERNATLIQRLSDYTCIRTEVIPTGRDVSDVHSSWGLYFKVKSNKLSNDNGERVFDAANQHWPSYIEAVVPEDLLCSWILLRGLTVTLPLVSR